jgi:hypothetical protein
MTLFERANQSRVGRALLEFARVGEGMTQSGFETAKDAVKKQTGLDLVCRQLVKDNFNTYATGVGLLAASGVSAETVSKAKQIVSDAIRKEAKVSDFEAEQGITEVTFGSAPDILTYQSAPPVNPVPKSRILGLFS